MGLSLEMTYLHFFFIYSYVIVENIQVMGSRRIMAHVGFMMAFIFAQEFAGNPPRTLDLGLDERRCHLNEDGLKCPSSIYSRNYFHIHL